jgi:hypothetical protein
MQLVDGLLRLRVVGHLHESEAARPARLAVGDDLSATNRAIFLEQLQEVIGRGIPGEVAYVNVLRHQNTFRDDQPPGNTRPPSRADVHPGSLATNWHGPGPNHSTDPAENPPPDDPLAACCFSGHPEGQRRDITSRPPLPRQWTADQETSWARNNVPSLAMITRGADRTDPVPPNPDPSLGIFRGSLYRQRGTPPSKNAEPEVAEIGKSTSRTLARGRDGSPDDHGPAPRGRLPCKQNCIPTAGTPVKR